MLCDSHLKFLERVQKMCSKIILPGTESYHERLSISMIPELRIFSENLYRNHFLKVALDEHHQLHTLMLEKQSTHRHHSARLKESFLVRTRTAKRDSSFSSMAQKICRKTVLIELEPFPFFIFYDMMKEQPTVLYDIYYASQQWYNKQICNL